MKTFVIDILGGGCIHVEAENKSQAIHWFFEHYPYNNFTDCRELGGTHNGT